MGVDRPAGVGPAVDGVGDGEVGLGMVGNGFAQANPCWRCGLVWARGRHAELRQDEVAVVRRAGTLRR